MTGGVLPSKQIQAVDHVIAVDVEINGAALPQAAPVMLFNVPSRPFGYAARCPGRARGLQCRFHFRETGGDSMQFDDRLAELLVRYLVRVAVIFRHR